MIPLPGVIKFKKISKRKEHLMKVRSFLSVLLLAVPLLFLAGCGKKKATDSKKTAQAGRGLPPSGGQKGTKKYGKNVEAFMLDDQDDSEVTTLDLNGQDQANWTEDRSTKGFEPVFFDFDKFNIREDQKQIVAYDTEKAKAAVQENKQLKVEGHADKHYVSELYNLAISQKRAHTMVNALAEAGVDKNALHAVGFGATRPALDMPGKVQENRRAEIVILTA